ncbi:MAG: hypothetical protein KBG02_09420 [Haliscomenobacter sp.]|nr:hypothetical protein [Haliscomenobacter sp.]MBP9872818.1 hypothetical protein [Haliscomenobacter sp.]
MILLRQRFLTGLLLLAFLFTGAAFSALSAQGFSPDITVALDGSGDFTKIQDAINAVPDNSPTPTLIFIKRGLYNTEKLIVPATKARIVLIGESRDETIISYHVYDCSAGGYENKCPAEDAKKWQGDNIRTSATLTVIADDFRAENLTIQNTAGPVGQALALTLRGDRAIFRNCNFSSYQDTIYFWSDAKRAYFENCLVIGRTDYLYGSGTVFFQGCEIRSWGGGWITAPSTGLNQPYGFVFNQCKLTYALNSPRPGDDGALVALGRPWHNYPKVAWLYCDMTEKINPLGWPDKWNMPYADTSANLHLYEYKNTGPGANRSGRAKWTGLRALTDEEAPKYTLQSVVSGSDGWDPSATAPVTATFKWTGAGAGSGWLLPGNWDPQAVPDSSQAAYVDGGFTITADGGRFPADLTLTNGATLAVSAPSEVVYLAIGGASILAAANVRLDGRIRTKDSLSISVGDTFALNATLTGVHRIEKTGAGTLRLNGDNSNFSGFWAIVFGSVAAAKTNSLGRPRTVIVDTLATLIIETSDAMFAETPLSLQPGGRLQLQADVVLRELYLGGSLQVPGVYSAATHPNWISGSGTLTIGRPGKFTFKGGANGNWDNPAHFQPALLPEAGETVYTQIEMETTSFVFPADIVVQSGGRIRLRGEHRAAGTIYLEGSASFGYATSGTGFTLNAPLVVSGNAALNMNSRAVPGHAMRLDGPICGNGKITALNQRTDTKNTATVVLSGDNSGFSGIWDLTMASAFPGSIAVIQGKSPNAFGQGLIEIGLDNLAALSHEQCAGDELRVNLAGNGRIQLDTLVKVKRAVINGTPMDPGAYDANTKPEWFTGKGMLMVDTGTDVQAPVEQFRVFASNNTLYLSEEAEKVAVYHLNGQAVLRARRVSALSMEGLTKGMYIVHYTIGGYKGVLKVAVQ